MIEPETLAAVVDWTATVGLVSVVICVGFVAGAWWASRGD
jgi:hypothetical protein